MSGSSAAGRCWLAFGLAMLLAGCSPIVDSQQEDDNPVIREAVARKEVSPREAARILEKALEANPQLARAHWELGLICLEKTSNYAAAVYHFQKVLEMRPDWKFANTAKQLINNSKIELVKEGVEAPTLPSTQQIIDRYVKDVHDKHAIITNLQNRVQALSSTNQLLALDNAQLRQQLQAALAQAQAPPTQPANPVRVAERGSASPPGGTGPPPALQKPPPQSPAANPREGTTLAGNRSPAGSGTAVSNPRTPDPRTTLPAPTTRSYSLKTGETLFAVARRNGVTVKEIVALNPNIDPARVKAGQVIKLPGR